MSMFALRPEEPAETAGVPSEPEHAESPAERLTPTTTDAASLDIAGLTSVTISLPSAGPTSD